MNAGRDGERLLSDALALAGDVRARLERLDGLHVLKDELLTEEASHDLDPLQIFIDVSALGINGYQAADWLREHCCIDKGLSGHRRVLATLSMADDAASTDRLLDAMGRLAAAAAEMPAAKTVDLPSPEQFDLLDQFGETRLIRCPAPGGGLAMAGPVDADTAEAFWKRGAQFVVGSRGSMSVLFHRRSVSGRRIAGAKPVKLPADLNGRSADRAGQHGAHSRPGQGYPVIQLEKQLEEAVFTCGHSPGRAPARSRWRPFPTRSSRSPPTLSCG